ncbi:DUF3180 domain-containing protein [Blastococcus sp. MG754426]|uniref:DUF3180 domain-containing protein n=1 Tax=unclassified Blastococcus TaxID=2619396 RepID=UPI001EF1249C|nr:MULTISPECIES: DUF3180 domain-containing protein [unclassified Blastococcus]MCF6506227.1 DUF3180 domain-containing protein [Blastococcus sp. MG754426]MCF6510395.1 DUF3180 domain-containing protein [Blastococcus sp. MG754427]MCF6736424.1 DUF3180 domain-containing protein [Blastococcus sp. KM273129]
MAPVRRRDLAVLALGFALAAWVLVRAWYGDLPPLRWWLPAPLAVLALAEALGARVLRSRLHALREARAGRGPTGRDAAGVRPVEPMLVARLAVLAQASAYVGAVFAGVWLGVLAYAGPAVGRLQAAGSDTVTAVLGLLAALALVAAALLLESACRVPPGSADDDPSPGVAA